MIVCSRCGKQLPDTVKFCTGCGTLLKQKTIQQHSNTNQIYSQQSMSRSHNDIPPTIQVSSLDGYQQYLHQIPENKSKKSFVAVIIAILAALLVLGTIFIFVVAPAMGIVDSGLEVFADFEDFIDELRYYLN